MQLVNALRLLWRLRVLTAAIVVAAVLVSLTTAYRVTYPFAVQSRHYDVGVASTRVLVDTPSSQVVDLGDDAGTDITALSARASLLATLMVSSPIKDEIARRVGLPPRQLMRPAADGGTEDGTLGTDATPTDDATAFTLDATVPTLEKGQLPMIYIQTQAPDAATAARLADTAVAQLKSHLSAVAAREGLPADRRLVVTQLGPARAAAVERGPGLPVTILVGVLVFVLGIGSIAGLTWLVRTWRESVAGDLDPIADDDVFDWPEASMLEPGAATYPDEHPAAGAAGT